MAKQSNVLSLLKRGLCILLLLQHVSCSKESSPSETKDSIAFDPTTAHYFVPPDSISVKPVFFVPKGEIPPTVNQKSSLIRHLKWAQSRYTTLLTNRGTFKLEEGCLTYNARHALGFYKQQTENGAPQYISELLSLQTVSRFNAPYVYVVILMNPHDGFPAGGGRPLNGGFSAGGGVVILSSYDLDNTPNFQSTLRHELGHSFGLPHVDVYGYDMSTDSSIMSYNTAHHTSYFVEAASPGVLIPEDLRGLALNSKLFPALKFRPGSDIPGGYTLYPRIIWLGPMRIPGQLPYHISVSTSSGETYNSSVKNIVLTEISPNLGPGNTFNPATMWSSGFARNTWMTVSLKFPATVPLDRIDVYSQHSGLYHMAKGIKIEAKRDGSYVTIASKDLGKAEESINFSPINSQETRLRFLTGDSGYVVIRGLRFFIRGKEIFPPLVPNDD